MQKKKRKTQSQGKKEKSRRKPMDTHGKENFQASPGPIKPANRTRLIALYLKFKE